MEAARRSKRRVFLDFSSLATCLAGKGLSVSELDQAFCFDPIPEKAKASRSDAEVNLREVLHTDDLRWCAAWLGLAEEAWRRADETGRMCRLEPTDVWLWDPLNRLLEQHELPRVYLLGRPLPHAQMEPNPFVNAKKHFMTFRSAAACINNRDYPFRAEYWSSKEWPAAVSFAHFECEVR